MVHSAACVSIGHCLRTNVSGFTRKEGGMHLSFHEVVFVTLILIVLFGSYKLTAKLDGQFYQKSRLVRLYVSFLATVISVVLASMFALLFPSVMVFAHPSHSASNQSVEPMPTRKVQDPSEDVFTDVGWRSMVGIPDTIDGVGMAKVRFCIEKNAHHPCTERVALMNTLGDSSPFMNDGQVFIIARRVQGLGYMTNGLFAIPVKGLYVPSGVSKTAG